MTGLFFSADDTGRFLGVFLPFSFTLGGGMLFIGAMLLDRWQKRLLLAGLGFALMVVGCIFGFSTGQAQKAEDEAIQKNRDAFFTDRGVYIPDAQLGNLEFPKHQPTEDAKFGIAQAEYEGKVISVFLTWEDDELKLYRTDGQELLPLD